MAKSFQYAEKTDSLIKRGQKLNRAMTSVNFLTSLLRMIELAAADSRRKLPSDFFLKHAGELWVISLTRKVPNCKTPQGSYCPSHTGKFIECSSLCSSI